MDYEQQQQKGLFTFYREQADLEDELKMRRHLAREGRVERVEEKEKKIQQASQHLFKHQHQHKRTLPPSLSEHIDRRSEEGGKVSEPKDKLIEILKNYNAKQAKKRDHLRIIMESQEESRAQHTQNLKNRLQKLLDSDENAYFNLMMADRAIVEGKNEQQNFTSKQEALLRGNPFQKLAIIPTNFVSDFDIRNEKQPLVKKSLKGIGNSLQIRRNDKIEALQSPKDRYLNISKEMLPASSNRLNLPKIESRTNSQVIGKVNKIKMFKLSDKSYFDPIRSERSNYRPQLSLFLDSVKLSRDSPSTKLHTENKIYSLFIQNKQLKRREQSRSNDNEIILSDVLKRLKYS